MIDLGHGALEQFFTVVAQAGLAEEARRTKRVVVEFRELELRLLLATLCVSLPH